jgi:NADH dehydrogenase
MPFFVIPERGQYRLQPVAGEDVAEIAVWAAAQQQNLVVDAAGPEIITYADLVGNIAVAVGRTLRAVHLPPSLTIMAAGAVGYLARDVMLTRQELEGLMEERLVSHEPPRGARRLDDWLLMSAKTIGRTYASELDRHWR